MDDIADGHLSRLLTKAPKKILLPRFDTLGDIVLLEGLLEALTNKYPASEIALVVQDIYLQLKPLFPERIKWFSTNAQPYREPNGNRLEILLSLLSKQQWDLILTTTFNRTYIDESVAVKFNQVRNIAVGGEREIAKSVRNLWQDLGLNKGKPTYEFVPVEEFSHETEKYKKYWENMTGEKTLPNPRLMISEDLSSNADNVLSALDLADKSFCICNPAGIANIKIKTWPEERFADVIFWIERTYHLRTLLTGHERESEHIGKVAALAKAKSANPLIWLGKDGEIPLLAALSQKARLYCGNDTSSMHIAGAVGIPVVGIFGGGTFPRFLPLGHSSIAVAGDLPCFHCYWDCIFGDAPCMKLVSVEDVKKAIDIILSGRIPDTCVIPAAETINKQTWVYIEKARDRYRSLNATCAASLETCKIELSNVRNRLGTAENQLLDMRATLKRSCQKLYKAKVALSYYTRLFKTEKINFGTDEAALFLLSGWSHNETLPEDGSTFNWATGKCSSLFLSLPNREVNLTVNVKSPHFANPQQVSVTVDGKKVGKWQLNSNWQWEQHSVIIKPEDHRAGISLINFRFSQNLKQAQDPRPLAVLFESLTLSD